MATSSDERLADENVSETTHESFDVTSKKKKSFNPIRSLKRFFAHGSSSRNQPTDDGNSDSHLVKASSVTDVVIGAEVPKGEISGFLQRQSKQMSISADSVFSAEKTADLSHPVAAMSSEAVMHDNGDDMNMLLQRNDDDMEGVSRDFAPFAESLNENRRTEHSLKHLQSDLNETEEDFFKDNWIISSKLSLCKREYEDHSDEISYEKEMDLNFVQRNSSLTSSAAVHRLAVRPKGKRVSSIHQPKLSSVSSEPQKPLLLLPLVKEENFKSFLKATDEEVDGRSESSAVHLRIEPKRIEEALSADLRLSTVTSAPLHGNSFLVNSVDAKDAFEAFSEVKSIKSHSMISDPVNLESKMFSCLSKTGKETVAECRVIPTKEESKTKQEEVDFSESLSTDINTEDDLNLNEMSLLQVSPTGGVISKSASREHHQMAAAAAVVIRQKATQTDASSVQETRETSAKRQTCAFPTETELERIGEKQTSKRSSLVLTDHQKPLVEAVDSELAQMFSKFQRRSSQKKQNEENESNKTDSLEANYNKEKWSSKTTAAGKVEKLQKDKIRNESEAVNEATARMNVKTTSTDSNVDFQEKITRPLTNEDGTSDGSNRRNRNGDRRLSAIDSMKPTKTRREIEMKEVENTENNNNEKRTEKILDPSKEKETKNKTDDRKQRYFSKTANAPLSSIDHSDTLQSKEDRTKAVKKSRSISYKATAPVLAKTPPAAAAAAAVSLGYKARSSSQSEMTQPSTEVASKTSSTQALRRGSLTYTNFKTSAVPISENLRPSGVNIINSVTDNTGQQTKDMQRSVDVSMTTRSPVRHDANTRTETTTCNDQLASTVASVSDAVVPPGTSAGTSIPKIISPQTMQCTVKPISFKEDVSKRAESLPLVATPTTSQSSGEVVPKDAKKHSSLAGSLKKDLVCPPQPSQPKSTVLIRPATGVRSPHQKISQEDEKSVDEWMGMVRQKTKAWAEGKMDSLEKTSC